MCSAVGRGLFMVPLSLKPSLDSFKNWFSWIFGTFKQLKNRVLILKICKGEFFSVEQLFLSKISKRCFSLGDTTKIARYFWSLTGANQLTKSFFEKKHSVRSFYQGSAPFHSLSVLFPAVLPYRRDELFGLMYWYWCPSHSPTSKTTNEYPQESGRHWWWNQPDLIHSAVLWNMPGYYQIL